jgi:hypothetical protein
MKSMKVEAVPTSFCAATDGMLDGRDHVILFLRPAGLTEAKGYALTLKDARRLLRSLRLAFPDDGGDGNFLRIAIEE